MVGWNIVVDWNVLGGLGVIVYRHTAVEGLNWKAFLQDKIFLNRGTSDVALVSYNLFPQYVLNYNY